MPNPDEFKAVIASHIEGETSHIRISELFRESTWPKPGPPGTPELFVVRESKKPEHAFTSIERFWASALFNSMEDSGGLAEFRSIGALGSYRVMERHEAGLKVGELMLGKQSEIVSLPAKPELCYEVFDTPELSGFVGQDALGRFAVLMCRWNLMATPTWETLRKRIQLTSRSSRPLRPAASGAA